MNPTAIVRGTAALALGGTATVLSGTAKALQFVAGRLRGPVEEAAPEPVRGVVDRVADVADSAADTTSRAADDASGAAVDERDAVGADADEEDGGGTGGGTGVGEATARLEDLAGRTSGAPPEFDELVTPADARPPTSTSLVGTAHAAAPSDLIVPADVATPGVEPPPTAEADVSAGGGSSRTFESQTAALAAKPAGEIVRAVREMSTDELEALLDYEMSHRKRKTVLGAIERELTPPTEELVYSSPDR